MGCRGVGSRGFGGRGRGFAVEDERGEAIGGQGVSRSLFCGGSGVQAPGVMDRFELRGAGDDVDVLLGVGADARRSFLKAPFAGFVMPAHVPGTFAAIAVVRACALVERRELARAVLLEAHLKNAVEEVVAHFP